MLLVSKNNSYLFLFFISSCILTSCIIFSACSKQPKKNAAKVFIKEENGRYAIYKDGKPFLVKGVAGFTHLKELSACGGNTIRIWDTTNIDQILKEANF